MSSDADSEYEPYEFPEYMFKWGPEDMESPLHLLLPRDPKGDFYTANTYFFYLLRFVAWLAQTDSESEHLVEEYARQQELHGEIQVPDWVRTWDNDHSEKENLEEIQSSLEEVLTQIKERIAALDESIDDEED